MWTHILEVVAPIAGVGAFAWYELSERIRVLEAMLLRDQTERRGHADRIQ